MSGARKRRSREFERICHEMEDVFQTMLATTRSSQFRTPNGINRGWRPAIEMYESQGTLYVIAELAGMSEEQIEVSVGDDMLTIRGERSPLSTDRDRAIYEMGILYGPFAANVYLPYPVDKEAVEAVYENGLLKVSLRRVEPKQITVKQEEQTY